MSHHNIPFRRGFAAITPLLSFYAHAFKIKKKIVVLQTIIAMNKKSYDIFFVLCSLSFPLSLILILLERKLGPKVRAGMLTYCNSAKEKYLRAVESKTCFNFFYLCFPDVLLLSI